ncbi:MAG: YggT family protein [Chloroflexota bacterium]
MASLAYVVQVSAAVLTYAIIARVILSWFPMRPDNPVLVFLYTITEPILAPLRRVLPPLGMLDLSPLVAIIILQVLEGLLVRLLLA